VKICAILWLEKNHRLHEINTEAEGKIMKIKRTRTKIKNLVTICVIWGLEKER